MRIATDVGGTFTDLVFCRKGDNRILIDSLKVVCAGSVPVRSIEFFSYIFTLFS